MPGSGEIKNVTVHFPCIHSQVTGQMVSINCFAAPESKSVFKAINGVDPEIARRVIGASRYGETDPRAGLGVIASFSTPLFHGESYGLGLAVADKLARYIPVHEDMTIYATGSIPVDGCGSVVPINGFIEKIDLVTELAAPDSLFLFPKDNLNALSEPELKKMRLLAGKGVNCLAVSKLDDLLGRVWRTEDKKGQKTVLKEYLSAVRVPLPIWRRAFGVVLVSIICFLVYQVFSGSEGVGTAEVNEQKFVESSIPSHQENNTVTGQSVGENHRVVPHDEKATITTLSEQSVNVNVVEKQEQTLILESGDTDTSQY